MRSFSAYATTTKYRPYAVKLRLYGDFGFLNVFFGYRGEIPEGSFIRITELNGQAGNYGEAVIGPAELTETNATLLSAQIFSTRLTESVESARAVGIDPSSGDTLFELRLAAQSEIIRPNATYVSPTPGPQVTQATQLTPPAPTQTPTPTPTASEIPADTVLARYKLTVAQKPVKYSHYNANLIVYPEDVVLKPIFRYHDPLPEGALMRITSMASEDGQPIEALITLANLENASEDLLAASIAVPVTALSDPGYFELTCIDPATGESIFSVVLAANGVRIPAQTSAPSNGGSYDITDGLIGSPAPTPYSPTYNYNNNNYGWINSNGTSWIEEGMQIQTPNPYGSGWGWGW